jgi:hypothetical protein
METRRCYSRAGLALVLLVMTVTAGAQVTVTGPIAGTPLLDLGKFDLAALGYVTEEFFLSGTATSYKRVGQLTEDGNWQVEHAATAPFTTRIVVVRPTDPGKFNGTAVVEWLNVSAGTDLAADWSAMHREIVRDGFAYVGVSAQKVGVEGGPSLVPNTLPIKKATPRGMAGSAIRATPSPTTSYSQAGRAVRGSAGAKVLGPLAAKRLLATGDSQSAVFLTTYVNAIDPIAKVYDGYLIHSRFASAASIEGASMLGDQATCLRRSKLRADLRVPVITVITETDLIGGLAGFHLAGFLNADAGRHQSAADLGNCGSGACRHLHFWRYLYRLGFGARCATGGGLRAHRYRLAGSKAGEADELRASAPLRRDDGALEPRPLGEGRPRAAEGPAPQDACRRQAGSAAAFGSRRQWRCGRRHQHTLGRCSYGAPIGNWKFPRKPGLSRRGYGALRPGAARQTLSRGSDRVPEEIQPVFGVGNQSGLHSSGRCSGHKGLGGCHVSRLEVDRCRPIREQIKAGRGAPRTAALADIASRVAAALWPRLSRSSAEKRRIVEE